jgi:hypothetical protein
MLRKKKKGPSIAGETLKGDTMLGDVLMFLRSPSQQIPDLTGPRPRAVLSARLKLASSLPPAPALFYLKAQRLLEAAEGVFNEAVAMAGGGAHREALGFLPEYHRPLEEAAALLER